MKSTKFFPIVFFIVALVFASLACNFSASTANITNAHMSRDEGDTEQTNVFTPADASFYCFFDLNNAPDDTVIKGIWTLVEADGYDSNSIIDEVSYTGGDDTLYFSLAQGNTEWPVGKYKIDLYLNDELVQTLNFEVQ